VRVGELRLLALKGGRRDGNGHTGETLAGGLVSYGTFDRARDRRVGGFGRESEGEKQHSPRDARQASHRNLLNLWHRSEFPLWLHSLGHIWHCAGVTCCEAMFGSTIGSVSSVPLTVKERSSVNIDLPLMSGTVIVRTQSPIGQSTGTPV